MRPLDYMAPESAWSVCPDALDHYRAAHLVRRAGFGIDAQSLQDLVGLQPAEAISRLRGTQSENSATDRSADALARATLATSDASNLSAAWVYRIMRTPDQLREKMTLFWHGHFATSAEKVEDAAMMWQQNNLLREHALGNFAELTQLVAKDPAMLIYLDSESNRKAHPNENFARELMELFCLGEGNYSEDDVLQLARCFTGWEVRNRRFRKNRYQHDSGEKAFLGASGRFNGEEAIDIVLRQEATPKFIARKLFHFFVCDDQAPSDDLLLPIAETLRANDLHIDAAVRQILTSNLFHSSTVFAQKIRSPVELVCGFMRSFEVTTNTQAVARDLRDVGQGLYYPPNVKGWDGGRAWINSSTLLGRSNMLHRILQEENTKFAGGTLSDYLQKQQITSLPAAIAFFCQQLLALPIPLARQEQIANSADAEQFNERSLRRSLHSVLALPECQLA
ncbi:MAG: DUF1800 domain-containing protein [Aureliella sp.]